jgi:hypothetical protein
VNVKKFKFLKFLKFKFFKIYTMSDLINYNKIILQKHNQMKNDFNYIKKFILKKLFYSKEN